MKKVNGFTKEKKLKKKIIVCEICVKFAFITCVKNQWMIRFVSYLSEYVGECRRQMNQNAVITQF